MSNLTYEGIQAAKTKILSTMCEEQHSRKFRFNELKRKLNASHGSLDETMSLAMGALVMDGTINRTYSELSSYLYYVVGSKQDPNYTD